MGDYDIERFGEGEHGIDETRASVHVTEPQTTVALREALSEALSMFGAQRDLLVSIHGWPKRGSKNDVEFTPGDHRVYSKYIRVRSLEEYIRRDRAPGRSTPFIEFANQAFQEWGWNRVDGLTLAYIEPVEE